MGKPLKFVPKLSLEELALRTVVASLWNEADVLASISKLQTTEKSLEIFPDENEEWRVTVENKVKNKVAELALPETLKKRMMLIVRPIGLQLREWYITMDKYIDYSRKQLELLCWTSSGAIDYQKSTEKLVRLGTIGILERFRAACFSCLVDSIPVVWEEVPEHYKRYLQDDTDIYAVADMEIYWAYVLKEEESKLDVMFRRCFGPEISTFHRYAFENSAKDGNKPATEYFFQKLTDEERDDCLVNTVCSVAKRLSDNVARFGRFEISERHLSDVLCYLLSVMSPEQQMQALKKNRAELLNCFLDCPGQDFYFDIADVTFPQEI